MHFLANKNTFQFLFFLNKNIKLRKKKQRKTTQINKSFNKFEIVVFDVPYKFRRKNR